MKYYKILNEDGSCCHGGSGSWHLPEGKKPGKWMPKIEGELQFCLRGYHILKAEHILQWAGPALFEVETKGEVLEAADKCLVRQARLIRRVETWNDRTLRLFACDCGRTGAAAF